MDENPYRAPQADSVETPQRSTPSESRWLNGVILAIVLMNWALVLGSMLLQKVR
jgi:hypothetical protein